MGGHCHFQGVFFLPQLCKHSHSHLEVCLLGYSKSYHVDNKNWPSWGLMIHTVCGYRHSCQKFVILRDTASFLCMSLLPHCLVVLLCLCDYRSHPVIYLPMCNYIDINKGFLNVHGGSLAVFHCEEGQDLLLSCHSSFCRDILLSFCH